MDRATGIDLVDGANTTIAKTMSGGVAVYEISSSGGGAPFDPATATTWWFPLVDSDGTCVLDSNGALIPTLIPL
jgi:hypothetical protein